MSDMLKGNYEAPQPDSENGEKELKENLEQEFEAAALEKLGGSITFVKKTGAPFVRKGEKNG